MQRQLLSRLLAGAASLLAGLLAFPFHGKLTYMLLVGLVGIVGGIVLAVVCMGEKEIGSLKRFLPKAQSLSGAYNNQTWGS